VRALDRSKPAVAKALTICQPLLPATS
jgi:hypothetical protein